MLDPQQLTRELQNARDALNGAVNAAARGDLFSAGAYTRNAHAVLETLLDDGR